MTFHLNPTYHNNWFPFRHFNRDINLMRNVMDNSPTIEPNYAYEADSTGANFDIELPGVTKKDISVEVNDTKLFVTAKRFKIPLKAQSHEPKNGDTESRDQEAEQKPILVYGLEARLGHGVDLNAIKADHLGDGILRVHVPVKAEEARRVQISF